MYKVIKGKDKFLEDSKSEETGEYMKRDIIKKEQHNGIISFWKFMFSLLICAFHLGTMYKETRFHFTGGSIAVEFFFLVSGFLFCKKCMKYNKKDNEEIIEDDIKLTWKSITRFFPYVLFFIIIAFIYTTFILKYSISDYIDAFYRVLLLPTKGAKEVLPYTILWYLSALIITDFVIFPLLVKYKKKYSLYFAPIIFFILFGYLLIKYDNIIRPWKKDIFVYKSLIRSFMEMNLGIFLYSICEYFKKVDFKKISRVLLTIIEILGYLSIFIICNKSNVHIRFDTIILFILSISILISFSGNSILNNFANNKVFYYLEKLSLPMYINNWLIVMVVQYIIGKNNLNISYYIVLLITICILIFISIIELFIVDKYEKNKEKMKIIFIKK